MANLISKVSKTKSTLKGLNKWSKKAGSAVTALGSSLAAMGGAAGTAAGAVTLLTGTMTAASAGAGTMAVKAAAFEKAMRGVARTAGLSEEEVSGLSSEILRLSQNTPRTRIELAKIATEAGRLGIQGTKNIRKFTNVVQQMAAVSELSVQRAATELAKISEALGRPMEAIRGLADTIDKLSITTPSSTGQITRAMRKMASGMTDQIELSTKAVASLSASLTSLGQEPARAGTRLRRVLNQLTDPEVIQDMAKHMDDTADTIKDRLQDDALPVLKEFLNNVKETGRQGEILNEVFVSSATAALLPLSENMNRFNRILEDSKDSMGVVSQEFETQLKNMSQQFEIFQSAVGDTFTEVGLEASEEMRKGIQDATVAVKDLTKGKKLENLKEMSEVFGGLNSSILAWKGTTMNTLFQIGEGFGLLTKTTGINFLARELGDGLDAMRGAIERNVNDIERVSTELDHEITNLIENESIRQARAKTRKLKGVFEEIGETTAEADMPGDILGIMGFIDRQIFGRKGTVKQKTQKRANKLKKTYRDTLESELKDLSDPQKLKLKALGFEQIFGEGGLFPSEKAVEKTFEGKGEEGFKDAEESIIDRLTQTRKNIQDGVAEKAGEDTKNKIRQALFKDTIEEIGNVKLAERLQPKFSKIAKNTENGLLKEFRKRTGKDKGEVTAEVRGVFQDLEEAAKDENPTQALAETFRQQNPKELAKALESWFEEAGGGLKENVKTMFDQLNMQKQLEKQFEGLSVSGIKEKVKRKIGGEGGILGQIKSAIGADETQEGIKLFSQVASGSETMSGAMKKASNKGVKQLINSLSQLDFKQKEVFSNLEGRTKKVAQSMRDGFKSAANVFNQEMGRMATGAEVSTAKIRDAFIQNLVTKLNQRLVTSPIMNMLTTGMNNIGSIGNFFGGGTNPGAGPEGFLRGFSDGSSIADSANMLPSIIPGRAKGGRLREGLNIVGERGPEVLASQSNGRVMSNKEMRDALKGGGEGVEINVINNTNENVDTQQRKQNGKPITDIIIGEVSKDIRKNGQVAQAMSQSFGVQRQGQRM